MNCSSCHRDLKPTNVLLDEGDRPLLMDLGSMNRARIEVKGSREAMTVQVRGKAEALQQAVRIEFFILKALIGGLVVKGAEYL